MERKFGLIGYPLSHSFSKKYFGEKFLKENIGNCVYDNYPIDDIGKLISLIKTEPKLVGLNVTIPYKEKVIPYLTDIDADAKEIGAVNTIRVSRDVNGVRLKGFNTDVYGFRKPLEDVLKPIHAKALILGTGGASKAVAWVLKSLNIEYVYVSRTPKTSGDLSYEQLSEEIIEENKVIINTSPIGMYPNVDAAPNIPYGGITREHILYDLVYNPLETLFLKNGADRRATAINGLPMLYLQAEKAWEIWNRD